MLTIKNTTLTREDKTILDKLNFTLPTGDILLIRGASGSGKSTILHLVTGELTPTSGTILVDNIDIHKLHKKALQKYRRRIGFSAQNGGLLPRKTVRENISFALEVCDATDLEIQKTADELLALTGLASRADALPHELSGGEIMRTSIARAITHRPALLLLDEPTGHLDDQNAKKICELIAEINKMGATILITTHDDRISTFFKTAKTIELKN